MDKRTKNTLIIVGASTAIGFLGDVIMYSVAASKGKSFKIEMPRGKELAQVLIIGIVTGVIVDFAVNQIVKATKSKEQLALEELVDKDVAKLEKGELKTAGPERILWKPLKA